MKVREILKLFDKLDMEIRKGEILLLYFAIKGVLLLEQKFLIKAVN